MALTIRNWLVVCVTACMLVAIGLLHRNGAVPVWMSSVRAGWVVGYTPLPDAREKLVVATDRLRLLELRDSVLAVHRQRSESESRAGLTVLVDPRVPVSLSRMVDTMASAQWMRIAPAGGAPVVLAVVLDTSRAVRGLPRQLDRSGTPMTAFLPNGTDGRTCLILSRLTVSDSGFEARWANLRRRFETQRASGALLGPCAFYAAYGRPGPGIEGWLRAHAWRLARFASWDRAPTPLGDAGWPGPEWLGRFLWLGDTAWASRQLLTPDAIACTSGRQSRCLHALLATSPDRGDSAWDANIASTSGYYIFAWWGRQDESVLGPNEGWVLSDLARTLGPKRFAQFWRSGLSPEQAYRAASGADLGAWTQEWAQRNYGRDDLGAVLTGRALIAGLLLALGAVTLAAMAAQRRRVA